MKQDDDKFVRHGGDGSSFTVTHAFRCAKEGIGYAFKTQRNFKIHTVFAILAIVLAALLRVSSAGWLAIVLCIAAVFALETLNTAIEALADLVSPDWNELVKRTKDCAAGAVLIAAIGSIAVACIVYIPAFLALI
jgi:diacylglycerol kinase (ATP)